MSPRNLKIYINLIGIKDLDLSRSMDSVPFICDCLHRFKAIEHALKSLKSIVILSSDHKFGLLTLIAMNFNLSLKQTSGIYYFFQKFF